MEFDWSRGPNELNDAKILINFGNLAFNRIFKIYLKNIKNSRLNQLLINVPL